MQKTKIICTVILIIVPIFGFAQDMINNFEIDPDTECNRD